MYADLNPLDSGATPPWRMVVCCSKDDQTRGGDKRDDDVQATIFGEAISLAPVDVRTKTMQDQIETMMRGMLAEALRGAAEAIGQPQQTEARATGWPAPKRSSPPAPDLSDHGRADVYMAGCSALSALAQRLQIPIFKVGATRQPLLTRQTDLCADRYGSAFKLKGVLHNEPGFDDWEMRRLPPIAGDEAGIASVPRALRVSLTMPFAQFEAALRTALRPHSLQGCAKSNIGRAHLAVVGADAAVAQRFTMYGFGDQVRGSPCAELHVIRPRLDMPVICATIGTILAAGR